MPLILTIVAALGATTPMQFCCVTEGRYLLDFQLTFEPKEVLLVGDTLQFSFRNVFNDQIVICTRDVDAAEIAAGSARVQLFPGDVSLPTGSYHVRVDALREGASVCGPNAGSCELYVAREGESPNHVLGSYFLSRAAYAWHPGRKLYNRNTPKLPPTLDPFDPNAIDAYWKKVGDTWELHPELLHDGGVGYLHGAEVYRALGETDRVEFCETVMKRTIASIFDHMIGEDGKLSAIRWTGETPKRIYHIRQQDGFVLKFLSQAFLYFRDVAGDEEYARALFEKMQPMADHQFSQENPLGCGGGCKVYDGRILAGLTYYCLTEREATGAFNEAHVKTALDFAQRAGRHCLAERGWYDEDCYVEGRCHIGFGTQNILCGLLPARRIALATGDEKLAGYLGDAAMAGFDFLARTNGALTGYLQWIPARHSGWANGNMHEILDEIKSQDLARGELPQAQLDWYYKNLWYPRFDYWVLAFHRADILATVIMECGEYKALGR